MKLTLREQDQLYKKAAKAIRGYAARPDITDIEFGVKLINGAVTDQLCIRFNVKMKESLEALKSNIILPKELDGFPVDVVDFNHTLQTSTLPPQSRIRPLMGGTQILSEVFVSDPYAYGTMGGILNIQGQNLAITNYHVLYGAVPPEVVKQYYAGKARVYQNLFSPSSDNTIGITNVIFDQALDFALFAIAEPANNTQSLNGINGIIDALSAVRPIYGQTRVKKTGAKTGVTFGLVTGQSLLNPARISIISDPASQPKEQPISDGGDSGSLWIVNDNSTAIKIVGLHCQGDGLQSAGAILFTPILNTIKKQIH